MVEELDELNRLFTSKNVGDIIKFYDRFENANQLVEWMKKRPSAPMKIYEVEGDKDIVIVIPTADHNGEYAKNCANEIFKGQQIVFVESNGPFFNYSRSCNFGLDKALKYEPKWIIISNDDIIQADKIFELKTFLSNLNYNQQFLILPDNNRWNTFSLRKMSTLYNLFESLKGYSDYIQLLERFGCHYNPFSFSSKFSIKQKLRQITIKFFTKEILTMKFSGDFMIFNMNAIKLITNKYNEFYIKVKLLNINIFQSNYKINALVSGTLGKGIAKSYKGIVGSSYFNYKLKNNYLQLLVH